MTELDLTQLPPELAARLDYGIAVLDALSAEDPAYVVEASVNELRAVVEDVPEGHGTAAQIVHRAYIATFLTGFAFGEGSRANVFVNAEGN